MATDVAKWCRVAWCVKQSILVFCIVIVGACASSPNPQAIVPPENAYRDFAQITIKRDFRLLGGANTHYIFNVFDLGDGVDYNAEAPTGSPYPAPYLIKMDVISGESFETIESAFVSFNIVDSELTELKRIEPRTHHEHLVERFDDSLIGTPLLTRVDPNGGSRIVATDPAYLPALGIHVVKLRQLYDVSERRLYRVVERAEEGCKDDLRAPMLDGGPPRVSGGRNTERLAKKIREALITIAPAIRSRPDDFLYAERCGFHVDRDLHWNAHNVGELQGFAQGTWYRPAGRMALYATLGGGPGAHAEEIYVEAGKQYVGLFDPYGPTFVIQEVE